MNTEWQNRIQEYCEAWTTDSGCPNFDRLETFYAMDSDVVIYDSLPPLEGFTGFAQMRSIYPGLLRLTVSPNQDLQVKLLADGQVAVTAFTSHMAYRFEDGNEFKVNARHTDVWEKRNNQWLIVHEHPSTVINPSRIE
ncbi:YybH family protein [Chamaesiphon minutus]|uniref:Ketosteroid isomerase-like enzyme n=1 Tax=Chamaesiphon minutus (strain ATCC 27169 / PCC 6605) TaxID=1173020 RepID=K9UPI9_CHAP6|nr:nuclear transport factor 2 family protein [Chamaesiphon minutus]AFY97007.1 ketosteroid isomerase-like enzyme [Chamaesiphon minutus PCC 6605]